MSDDEEERVRLLASASGNNGVGSQIRPGQYGGAVRFEDFGDEDEEAYPASWPPQPHSTRPTPIITMAGTATGTAGATDPEDPFHCHGDASGEQHAAELQSSNKRAVRVLWLSIAVCLFFMLCEVVGGVWAQSLAIITDAAHLLTDLASMLISIFSIVLASRPASQRMSFGWHRAEVVGAFISVFMIWIVTGVLVYLAIDRMITQTYDIDAKVMAITAGLGVVVNLLMGVLLYFGGHSHSHVGDSHAHSLHSHSAGGYQQLQSGDDDEERGTDSNDTEQSNTNINIRAAFIHVLGDLLQSIGVLIAALLILWRESWAIVDPICTLLFSVIVLSTTVYIVRDALVVLLEGRPSTIDFRQVFDELEKIDGVRRVHDLRIWALTMNKVAISVHLEVDPSAQAQTVLKNTTRMLRRNFNVHESTVQIEGYQPQSENCFQCVVPST